MEGEKQVVVVDEIKCGRGQATEQVNLARRTETERRDRNSCDWFGEAFEAPGGVDLHNRRQGDGSYQQNFRNPCRRNSAASQEKLVLIGIRHYSNHFSKMLLLPLLLPILLQREVDCRDAICPDEFGPK